MKKLVLSLLTTVAFITPAFASAADISSVDEAPLNNASLQKASTVDSSQLLTEFQENELRIASLTETLRVVITALEAIASNTNSDIFEMIANTATEIDTRRARNAEITALLKPPTTEPQPKIEDLETS